MSGYICYWTVICTCVSCKTAILFGFPMVRFRNGWDHSYSYCYDQPFQNQTIGNSNFKTFSIPICSVFKPLLYKASPVIRPHYYCIFCFYFRFPSTSLTMPTPTSTMRRTWPSRGSPSPRVGSQSSGKIQIPEKL